MEQTQLLRLTQIHTVAVTNTEALLKKYDTIHSLSTPLKKTSADGDDDDVAGEYWC